MSLKLNALTKRVVDRLNAGSPSEDRGVLVTQTVAATVAELDKDGFLELTTKEGA